jgi:hypothetical protein
MCSYLSLLTRQSRFGLQPQTIKPTKVDVTKARHAKGRSGCADPWLTFEAVGAQRVFHHVEPKQIMHKARSAAYCNKKRKASARMVVAQPHVHLLNVDIWFDKLRRISQEDVRRAEVQSSVAHLN